MTRTTFADIVSSLSRGIRVRKQHAFEWRGHGVGDPTNHRSLTVAAQVEIRRCLPGQSRARKQAVSGWMLPEMPTVTLAFLQHVGTKEPVGAQGVGDPTNHRSLTVAAQVEIRRVSPCQSRARKQAVSG